MKSPVRFAVPIGRVAGNVKSDRTGIPRRRRPIELERHSAPGAVARAGRRVLDEGNPGGARLRRIVLADHLRQVVNRVQVAGLPLLQVAVQSRREFEAPPPLRRVGNLHRHPLFDAGDIDRSALQDNLHAPRARIERAAGMTLCTGPRIVPGSSGNPRRRSVAMRESSDRRNARQHCRRKVKRVFCHSSMLWVPVPAQLSASRKSIVNAAKLQRRFRRCLYRSERNGIVGIY